MEAEFKRRMKLRDLLNKKFKKSLGGAFYKWKEKIEGRVIVEFKIKKDGSIEDIKVLKGVREDLDKEAVRIIKKMPKWTPGRREGKIVEIHITLPVIFKL